MIAQNGFGLPLRLAALKFILAPDTNKFRGRDFLQTRSEQLNLPDAYALAKNGSIRPARLMMSSVAGCSAVPRAS